MTDDTITFRTDPRWKATIGDLVRRGEYESEEAFVNEAIRLKFAEGRTPVEGTMPGRDPMVVYFESPLGRPLLREELGRTPAE